MLDARDTTFLRGPPAGAAVARSRSLPRCCARYKRAWAREKRAEQGGLEGKQRQECRVACCTAGTKSRPLKQPTGACLSASSSRAIRGVRCPGRPALAHRLGCAWRGPLARHRGQQARNKNRRIRCITRRRPPRRAEDGGRHGRDGLDGLQVLIHPLACWCRACAVRVPSACLPPCPVLVGSGARADAPWP